MTEQGPYMGITSSMSSAFPADWASAAELQMLPLKLDVCLRPLRMRRHVCETWGAFFLPLIFFFFFEKVPPFITALSRALKPENVPRAHWWDLNVSAVPPTWWYNKLDGGCRQNTSVLPASWCSVFEGVIATRCVSSCVAMLETENNIYKNRHCVCVFLLLYYIL